jgi:DNA-3-methyladenine glycosylase I
LLDHAGEAAWLRNYRWLLALVCLWASGFCGAGLWDRPPNRGRPSSLLVVPRFVFEINQAGLSWDLILKKQDTFRQAYHQFDIETVANYDEKEVERLLNDAGVIRNKLKVNAAIHNAKEILKLQAEHGTFKNWLEHQHPKTKEEWVKTFKKTFKFTGGEIVNEFLMSTGYLSGAHDADCHILKKIKNGKN